MSDERYLTSLSVPLLGLPRAAVEREVRAALEADPRVDGVRREPVLVAPGRPVEHLELSAYLHADTPQAAGEGASALHDLARARALAMLPPGAQVGWTSAFSDPEPVDDEEPNPSPPD